MTLKKGSAAKEIVDAINTAQSTADNSFASNPAAADITDATTVGKAVLTAASAAAARTALSVGEKVAAPSTAASTGTTGQWATDTGFFYSCTATNTWKRVAIATW